MEAEALRAVKDSGLPIFVLLGNHKKALVEHGTHGFVISHGDGDQRVDVGVLAKNAGARGDALDVRVHVADTLATRLHLRRKQQVPLGADAAEWFTSIEREARCPQPWEPIEIKVDGRLVSFSQLEADGHWVAYFDIGSAWLYIHSLGTLSESMELSQVDTTPGLFR
jgi:hypothetical protein